MKKFFFPIAMLVMAALAYGQDSAQPPKDLSGFSGYAWGAGIEFVTNHMEGEDYDLISASCKDLWYRGKLLNEKLRLVYLFEDGMLTSGIWIFDDVDYESYWQVSEFLQNTYSTNVEMTVKGDDWIEAEMWPRGTNAQIVHNLDVEDDRHEVHYYYRSGEE